LLQYFSSYFSRSSGGVKFEIISSKFRLFAAGFQKEKPAGDLKNLMAISEEVFKRILIN
jgi:hypothetical protein